MKVSWNWLKDYCGLKLPPEKTASLLTMSGLEVEGIEKKAGDILFLIEVTTNRPDCLSHVGIAREIAAVTQSPFHFPDWKISPSVRKAGEKVTIEIRDSGLCPYYSGCLIEGVEFSRTPDFMKRRLDAVGLRSINLVVDITNYCLLELAQPLHVFDWDLLSKGVIVVRRALKGEKFTAIDGKEYFLKGQEVVIADARSAIALGGVMGGLESETSEKTRNIFLESAYFNPVAIRRTSKELGATSESSYRFERGVDPEGVRIGLQRAITLLKKYAKGIERISPVFEAGRLPIKKRVIHLPHTLYQRITGEEISARETKGILSSLGMTVGIHREACRVAVPSFRSGDLSRPIDLVEEIARLKGYEDFPETLPQFKPIEIGEDPSVMIQEKVSDWACGSGFREIITYSLVSEEIYKRMGFPLDRATRVHNPKNQILSLLRPSLIPSMIEVMRSNLYRGNTDLSCFEIARVYGEEKEKELPTEELRLSLGVCGFERFDWMDPKRKTSLYDLKGRLVSLCQALKVLPEDLRFLEEPSSLWFEEGGSLSLRLGDQAIGEFGLIRREINEFYDIKEDLFLAELSLAPFHVYLHARGRMRPLPRFPFSSRDLSIIVKKEIKAEALLREIQSAVPDLIQRVRLFDLFEGGSIPKGERSLALRIEFRAMDRTLSNEEIIQALQTVVDRLKGKFGIILRS